MKHVGLSLIFLGWALSSFIGAFANSQLVAPAFRSAAFFWSIVLSLVVSASGVLLVWLLARQGRRPKLGLFYLLLVAFLVVFFGDRGTVSSVVFAMAFFKSASKQE